jgi:hypothetical protein
VVHSYNEYGRLTDGEKAVAGTLALAATLREWQPVTLARATGPSDRALSVAEAAARLHVTPNTVYAL